MSLQFHFAPVPDENPIGLKNLLENFKETINHPATQFFTTFNRPELLEQSKQAFQKFNHVKTFVHIGIGGSSLGPEMLISALKKSETRFIFINNIDPDEMHDQLTSINDLATTLFYFVSKSGGTAETLSALAIITQFLEAKNIPPTQFNKFFIFATDPIKSELRDIALNHQIETLEVPSNVGGRFCVLTPVGFLPAMFAGIEVEKLILGANNFQERALIYGNENPLLMATLLIEQLYSKNNINQTVIMPYSSKLKCLAFWFTQLWGESLGKKQNIYGNDVFVGLTPIPAYGATDQHSQVQLFMEGPRDKFMIIIENLNFDHDYSLKSSLTGSNLKKLAPYTLGQLMKAELHGTLKALQSANRPYLHITMERNDEVHLGELILFFESLTVLMGDALKVNPFDQPGVEAGKRYAFEFLTQLK